MYKTQQIKLILYFQFLFFFFVISGFFSLYFFLNFILFLNFTGTDSLCYFGQVTTSVWASKISIYKVRLSKYPSGLGTLWYSHPIRNV